MNTRFLLFLLSVVLLAASCKKTVATPEPLSTANLIIKFKFDSTQERLNNLGQPSTIAAGFAAQTPVMNSMSSHYIELAPSATTLLGAGEILYKADETTIGGATAIDFEKAKFAANDSQFLVIPIKAIKPGTYEWIRASLAYQNATVKFKVDTTISGIPIKKEFDGTLAGFIGFNTYIKNFKVKDSTMVINANKKQGFWGFETVLSYGPFTYPFSTSGQAPEGATTVVNPIFNTSPVPAGSCVVTGAFTPGKLTITGKETQDIIIELSFSINKSFEWQEVVVDGKWEPSKGELITDMGIRGMIPKIK
jgi:hypothetical protein